MNTARQDLLLALDCGTQSVRALLFDLQGQLVAKSQVRLDDYRTPQPGWHEHTGQDEAARIKPVPDISRLRLRHGLRGLRRCGLDRFIRRCRTFAAVLRHSGCLILAQALAGNVGVVRGGRK